MALNFHQLSGAVQNTSAVNLLQSVAQGLPSTEEKLGMNMEVEINNALLSVVWWCRKHVLNE